jgi:argininosuccinate lyase
MTLWGGRFQEKMDPTAWGLNASLPVDRRLASQDVRGSLAWARGLQQAGVLTASEFEEISQGLESIRDELNSDSFEFKQEDEDIHSAVERRLGELVGELAGKLHTGRSRNDQVATDLRLWLLDNLPWLDAGLVDLQKALVERAEKDFEIIFPGYTHLQRAQPILLAHWWLSHFWPLQRDRERLAQLTQRTAILPLGSGALAGTPFPIDRQDLAISLGFSAPCPNSLDGVADRDFAAEFLFCATLTGIHLSRLAEAVVLFSSAEFNYFELADAFLTGSSLMPQKKNPDIFELARGKAGTLLGALTGLLATLKGLPSAYDKDLQEDKAPVFLAADTLTALLAVMAAALRTLGLHPEVMQQAIDPGMLATDLADYLVVKGIPFRRAHSLAGQALLISEKQKKPLNTLPLETFQALDPVIDAGVYQVFDPQASVARRSAIGGTAPIEVRFQLEKAREHLKSASPASDQG